MTGTAPRVLHDFSSPVHAAFCHSLPDSGAAKEQEMPGNKGKIWWALKGSNLRPLPCEGEAGSSNISSLAAALDFSTPCSQPCVHYVGFRDDRYLNARKVFGGPAFIHRWWDRRAAREIAPDDVVVFAAGEADQQPCPFNAPDIDDDTLPLDRHAGRSA